MEFIEKLGRTKLYHFRFDGNSTHSLFFALIGDLLSFMQLTGLQYANWRSNESIRFNHSK